MADKLPKLTSLVLASYMAPLLRSGSMALRVNVVSKETGEVLREVSGIELGKALLRRANIELDVFPSPVLCPMCGGRKQPRSTYCLVCIKVRRQNEKTICPLCGGKKAPTAKTCIQHTIRAPKPEKYVCACGNAKLWKQKQCTPCRKQKAEELAAKRTTCSYCGGRKDQSANAMCRKCTNVPCSNACGHQMKRGSDICGWCRKSKKLQRKRQHTVKETDQ